MDASYCLCVLLFGKQIHEPISLQGDTFLWFYPVFLSSCSVMLSRCASRGRFPRDAQRDDGKRAIKGFLNVPVRGVLAESGRKPASYLYQCLCLVVKWCVPERGEKHIS